MNTAMRETCKRNAKLFDSSFFKREITDPQFREFLSSLGTKTKLLVKVRR